MSLHLHCPCDDNPFTFICPYNAQNGGDCEYFCGEDEPYDEPDYNEDMGFDPYMGCYTDDC